MKNESEIFLLQVKVPNPRRFNSANFGTYTHPKTQKTVYLKNANGQLLANGYTTTRLAVTFNTAKPFEANIVQFLLDSPQNGVDFTLTNAREEKEKGNELLMRQIEVEGAIYQMDKSRLKVICASLGYTYDDEKNFLLAKIIKKVRQEDKKNKVYGVDQVKAIMDSKNAEIVFDIKEMLKYKVITKKTSGVYIYGEYSLGLNLDQVALYLQENQDIYAGIKKDLRPFILNNDILEIQ